MAEDAKFLPPHEPTWVPGFHAYSAQLGVQPGDEVDLRVSYEGKVAATVLHYRGPTIDQGAAIAQLDGLRARPQPIHRGSYVYVERGLEKTAFLSAEVWFRTLADAPQSGLICQPGFCLGMQAGNQPLWTVGEVTCYGPLLPLKEWHHLVGVFAPDLFALYLDGAIVASMPAPGGEIAGGAPLRLGAMSDAEGRACGLFTGDVCAPALYSEPLSPELIRKRFREKILKPAPGCVGHWKFDAVGGEPCRDTSPAQRHGRPVNYPIRMIPGPQRTEDSDWHSYDPLRDPRFGHAIRLMADAVVDCRWEVNAKWKVPEDTRSGQYGIRLENEQGETRHVHFIVRPAKPTAPLLCLSTTNTRIAYNFRPFDNLEFDYGAYHPHPKYPLLGQLHGVCRPATGALWPTTTVHFELPFYAWLEARGIAYDVYTEWDLEQRPELLNRYTAVAFAGHSEYWTAAHYERLRKFVQRGGHLLSLSGNTAYWRVSLDLDNGVMEVRKHARVPTAGTSCDPVLNAAHHHQMDHLPGATMREAGWPEASLLGGMTNGWTDPPLEGPRAGYMVLAPRHWAFNHPRRVDVDFPFAPRAAGYETDMSARSLLERCGKPKRPHYPDQSGRVVPTLDSNFDAGLAVLARAKLPDSYFMDYDNTLSRGEMWSEMLIQEQPGRGLIFAAGSVLASHILLEDENFANMLLNIMERMGLPVR